MEAVRLGVAIFVEDDEVGGEVGFVKNPTLKFLRVVDVIGLRNSRIDTLDPAAFGLRQNVQNGVCHRCQGLVERLLQ